MPAEPYLFFNGRCAEALELYKTAAGAELEMAMKYSESPEKPEEGCVPAGWESKIMHASVRIGGSRVMMSDGNSAEKADFKGFSMAMSVGTVEEAERVFGGLSEGGAVMMPLTKTFWSPSYGMLVDRFGLMWMVMVEQAE